MQQIFTSARLALQNIKANPLHTFLSTLGIVIGVAALVAILAFGDGLEQTGRTQLEKTTSIKNIAVTPRSSEMVDGVRVSKKDPVIFSPSHMDRVSGMIGNKGTTDLVVQRSNLIELPDTITAGVIIGSSHRSEKFIEGEIKGRYFNEEEYLNAAAVAVVSQKLTEGKKIDEEEVIGTELLINGTRIVVTGLIQDPDMPATVFVPYTLMNKIFDDLRPTIVVEAAEIELVPEIRASLDEWLDENFEAGKEGFSVVTYQQQAEQFKQGVLLFKLVMGAITGISVLVGGIGIMNVLLISVTERTKEIGIRKAAGARKKDIVLQFLSESVTISMVGCALGWMLGVLFILAFVPIVNTFVNVGFQAAIEPGTVLVVIIVALLTGMIFGTYPAYRASNLTPVDAIRHE